MKAIISRIELLKALRILRVVAKPSEFIPTSSGVLMESYGDRIRLTADSREAMCQLEIDAQLAGDGGVVVSADRLDRLLTYASDDRLKIEVKDGKSADIICGGIVAHLPGWATADFVDRKAFQGQSSFQIGLAELKNAVAKVSPILPSDSSLTAKSGIHVFGDGKRLKFEGTDGRALHVVYLDSPFQSDIVISQSVVDLIHAIEHQDECEISISENAIQISMNGTILQSQLLEGQYPNSDRWIPALSENIISLPKEELIRAVNVTRVVMDSKEIGCLNVSVKKGATTFSSYMTQAGDVQEVIESPNVYEVEFKVDPLRLITSIKQIQGKEVQIQCDDPLMSICIREGDFLSVIATMRPTPPIEKPIHERNN